MAWRSTLNSTLTRLTGYRIVSAHPAGRADKVVHGAAARRRGSRPSRPARTEPFAPDYDQAAQETIRTVQPWTMTSRAKLFGLILATRYVTTHEIPGAIVECGVWRGGSMQAVARTLLEQGSNERNLHLFDTFDGMPPPTDQDVRRDGKSAAHLLTTRGRNSRIWAVATLDDVRAGMESTGYPRERMKFHRGLIEETVPAQAPDTVALLRLDTDWYESTKHEMDHLYDRLSPGGVIIIDDYGYWQGARKAVDDFLEETGERLLLLPLSSGRIAVKPG